MSHGTCLPGQFRQQRLDKHGHDTRARWLQFVRSLSAVHKTVLQLARAGCRSSETAGQFFDERFDALPHVHLPKWAAGWPKKTTAGAGSLPLAQAVRSNNPEERCEVCLAFVALQHTPGRAQRWLHASILASCK